MSRHRHLLFLTPAFVLAVVFCVGAPRQVFGQAAKTPAPPSNQPNQQEKMTGQTRLLVIRSLQSERVFARVMFPQGDKGLRIKNGVVSPSEQVIAQEVAEYGPAVRPGDRCVITDVQIKDHFIIVEVTGGSKKHQKWYQHIQVVSNAGDTPIPGGPSPQSLDAHGTTVTLDFDKYVPELNGDQVRQLLAPVMDFKALTTAEAYEKTLPPKLQAAIKDHKVLVGMDKEMVTFAKGRPNQRIRDKDANGQDYEEWIYGTPPEEVDFVRFKGNEVARLEIMTVDGQKIVRTEKEIDLPSKETELAQQKPAQKPQNAPSLRRPGEEDEYPSSTSDHRTARPQDQTNPPAAAPSSPYPDSGGSNPTPGAPPMTPTDNPTNAPASTGPPHILPAS
jgi:hypothetical protein